MIKMALGTIIVILFLQSCFPDMTPPKSTIKKVKNDDYVAEWFTYSSTYANAPDYITMQVGEKTDTLCYATNIADINFKRDDTLHIGFYGRPKIYDSVVSVSKSVEKYKVTIDTNSTYRGN